MSNERMRPDDCRSMAEVRFGVDELDEEIVSRIGERFRYMEAAACIKLDRATVRDEARKAQVLENVRRLAGGAGLPQGVIDELYELLVEASIRFELDRFDAKASGIWPTEQALAIRPPFGRSCQIP